jgi:hypothetical protein
MTEVKKGKPSWKPAKKLQVSNKNADYEYRWCQNDPFNIQKKKADGWVMASEINGIHAEHVGEKSPTSVTEYRESVLMALPREDYLEHRAYYEEQTLKQTRSLKEDAQSKMQKLGIGAGVTGSIVIE